MVTVKISSPVEQRSSSVRPVKYLIDSPDVEKCSTFENPNLPARFNISSGLKKLINGVPDAYVPFNDRSYPVRSC